MSQEDRLLEMLRLAEDFADSHEDGHLTIMRFTTGWKIMFGTPELTIDGRDEIWRLATFKSLEAALENLTRG
jgi:hypothetical protein